MATFKNSMKAILASISAFFILLFGKVAWTKPDWIDHVSRQASDHSSTFWRTIIASIIVLFILALGLHWYHSLPTPQRIITRITPPNLTPIGKTAIPDHLNIHFGLMTHGRFLEKSVAPLRAVGKPIKQGINMVPAIAGEWRWESDDHLVFTPASDWPAGQTYRINFSKDVFKPGVKLQNWQASFSTLPFTAKIDHFSFYQNPVDPKLKQGVATVTFNYPVNTQSLEKHINLRLQTSKKSLPFFSGSSYNFTITYDDQKRTAYLQSENLTLPKRESFLELTVEKGIRAQTGPGVTLANEKATVLVPTAESYFKITRAETSIIRNPKDRPEQVLSLETSIGVTAAELDKAVHLYLLPKDYPATAAETAKINYHWHDPGEITPAILALSKPLALQAIPTDIAYATSHSYTYNTLAPAYVYLKLDKGVRGFGDYILSQNYTTVLKVPEYPQEIAFVHKGALLALGTEEKLSVLVRGLKAVKFNFARILPEDINHLITQTNGDFSHPYFIDASFNQNNISEIFSEIQQFDDSVPGKAQYSALDFSKYLSKRTDKPLGLFLLQAQGWDAANKTALDVQANRLILITDLGLIVKDNLDGTHDVFVQSVTQGKPVKNANVSILGKNGLALLTKTTDDAGLTQFPSLKDFENEREPVVYLVRFGNDVSFIPYARADRQLNYSRFDVGGEQLYEGGQTALTAYIFTDRGIYRPGDTSHIGVIVKKPFVTPQPQGLPLELTIVDPHGVTVKDEKITLDEYGFFALDFATSETSPTGQYLVNLYIVKDNLASNLIGSTTLNVAEFLPDRMRIAAHFVPEQTTGWVSPKELTAKVGLWNLYGAPATDRRIGSKILLTPKAVSFSAFPNYIFVDPLLNPKEPPKVYTDNLAEVRTDSQGQATLDLKLDRFEKATYQLTLFVEGFEADGGRSVATQTSTLVSPLPYFIGYKPSGDLRFINQNSSLDVRFIGVNPQLQMQSVDNLTLQLYSQRPITTLVKKENGTYQYQSTMQSTLVSSTAFAIRNEGTDYLLPTQQIGDFMLAIVDEHGTELSRLTFSVVGTSQQYLPKNAELTLKLNKTEFAPGEDIEMQIVAPYTGAGLITIERDKVYAQQWFKTDSTTSVQKIHIPNDFQGGGYVNVAFVRDINSPEIFTSPLSYSIVPFSVNHQAQQLQVTLNIPEKIRPGETMQITFQTNKPGKIIIFAVDEGILQVTEYPSPDPLGFFFKKQALGVTTSQIVDELLPKFIADRELSAVGGDNVKALLYKQLNPFKRKTEAAVIFWSGIIDTDNTPHQVNYSVPDYFSGSLRVMAVAVAADAVGSAVKSSKVSGDFVINPNVPTFVAPGDEFEISASIANNIEQPNPPSDITVTLTTTPQLEIIKDAKQTLSIPKGEERSVTFKLRANSELSNAELTWTVTAGDKNSKVHSTLSVRPAIPYTSKIISGYSTAGSKTLAIDRSLYPEYRKVEAMVSQSPLILVVGLQRYLEHYPYGCTEQLVSQAFPLLAMAKQPWFVQDTKIIADKVQQIVQMLGARQQSSGGFNYWPGAGSSQSNDFASVYALHFLTEAKAQGFTVPSDLFSYGISFLKNLVTQEVNDLEQARLAAYAIYLLTRNEIITTNYLTNLQVALDQHSNWPWQKDITSAYIATTYALLKNANEANRMIDYFKPDYTPEHTSNDFYNQNIANAQYLFLLSKHFPDKWQKIDNKLVMSVVNALNSETINTILSAYTSLALSAYGQYNLEANNGVISIQEILSDGKQIELTSKNMYQKAEISEQASKITFYNPSGQGYFYQLTQTGFDKVLPKHTTHDGIEVYREYRNMNDNMINTTHLGDEIIVAIRIRALDDQYHNNVAIVDLLPGGFEVVRDSVQLKNIDYADIREDRVIFFTSVSPDSFEISYRIKATNKGKFTVPPAFAMSMYNPAVQSLGTAANITVY